jgi:DNA polymerase epsilon subunit 2
VLALVFDLIHYPLMCLIFRAYFGNVNTFGGPSKVSLKTSAELLRYEHENDDAVLVFLADVWLDSIKVCTFVSNLF